METIEYEGVTLLTGFVKCCATCINAPSFRGSYRGRSNGFCKEVKAAVNRTSICDEKYQRNETLIKKMLGGLKGQAKWMKGK